MDTAVNANIQQPQTNNFIINLLLKHIFVLSPYTFLTHLLRNVLAIATVMYSRVLEFELRDCWTLSLISNKAFHNHPIFYVIRLKFPLP